MIFVPLNQIPLVYHINFKLININCRKYLRKFNSYNKFDNNLTKKVRKKNLLKFIYNKMTK